MPPSPRAPTSTNRATWQSLSPSNEPAGSANRRTEEDMQKFMKLSIAAILAAVSLFTLPAAKANMGSEAANESTDPNYLAGQKALGSQEWNKGIQLLLQAMQT